MKTLEGKVAFVTGGGSGIGFGMVRSFLAEGMKVVIADWSEERLAEVRQLLSGANAVHMIRMDVGDRVQVRNAASEAVEVFGRIHLLCNNAGVGGGGGVDDPDFDEWDRALRVNIGGVVNCLKTIVPIIREQGEGGHVVNTSSMAGVVPLPGMGAYATAKYAVRGLTDALRLSLAPDGIGVSCLFPGLTRSRIMDSSAEAGSAEAGQIAGIMDSAMDPMDLGAAVVRAIRANDPYIFTHTEFLDEVRDVHRRIEAAFPSDQEVSPGRQAFERERRARAAELYVMPVID